MAERTRRSRSAATRRTASTSTNTKADVIFAFFGYNESYAGEAGCAAFKKQLDDWIKHTLAQKYNGKTAPAHRAVLADRARGPAAIPICRTATRTTQRLELYTRAMAEVAKAHDVTFVDLFAPSRAALRRGQGAADDQRRPPERGRQPARSREVIDRALFGAPPSTTRRRT